ncbi:MAG: hypothetical protein R2695_00310 [Acidimicrobiales bacterium]
MRWRAVTSRGCRPSQGQRLPPRRGHVPGSRELLASQLGDFDTERQAIVGAPWATCWATHPGAGLNEIRFDGRVGDHRRGSGDRPPTPASAGKASVVVNDLGASTEGDRADLAPAAAVVDETLPRR